MTRLVGSEHALSTQLIGRAVLQACAELLTQHRIQVMPLKGIWLHEVVYGHAADREGRVISDVDVLVEPGKYRQAGRVLAQAGWHLEGSSRTEACYQQPGMPLPLDLHASLYTPGAYRMPSGPLFARGRFDDKTFGVPVMMPDPLDVLAHLVGHAAKSGNAWCKQGHELRDIPRMASVLQLAPERCAERLHRLGLARAARWVLPLTAANDPAGFGPAVLRALPPDPLGERLSRATSFVQGHLPAPSRVSALVGFALDSSLVRGGYALTLRAADKLADRLLVSARRMHVHTG
ncbi:MAG: nucleotidyltransferase family protein [Polyangiales bacterium]